MLPDDQKKLNGNKKENTQSGSQEKGPTLKDEHVIEAHKQADADIEQDPDLGMHAPSDDLDEGETARLGDDENDLV